MKAGRIWRWIGAIVGLIVLVAILGVAFIYSGILNVSAAHPDSALAAWVFSATRDHSVKRHAKGIETPALDDPAMVHRGFEHYRQMCMGCHGAPGVEISQGANAMNPAPPELTHEVEEWQPNELFWITKNGLRMTGMMAWGKSHGDEEIWAIVAFLRKLPSMTPDEFEALSEKASGMEEEEEEHKR